MPGGVAESDFFCRRQYWSYAEAEKSANLRQENEEKCDFALFLLQVFILLYLPQTVCPLYGSLPYSSILTTGDSGALRLMLSMPFKQLALAL